MRSRLIDKASICSEARHDLEARSFLAERENMQYRRSSDLRATADPYDRFKEKEVVMRRKCPGNVLAEVLFN